MPRPATRLVRCLHGGMADSEHAGIPRIPDTAFRLYRYRLPEDYSTVQLLPAILCHSGPDECIDRHSMHQCQCNIYQCKYRGPAVYLESEQRLHYEYD